MTHTHFMNHIPIQRTYTESVCVISQTPLYPLPPPSLKKNGVLVGREERLAPLLPPSSLQKNGGGLERAGVGWVGRGEGRRVPSQPPSPLQKNGVLVVVVVEGRAPITTHKGWEGHLENGRNYESGIFVAVEFHMLTSFSQFFLGGGEGVESLLLPFLLFSS